MTLIGIWHVAPNQESFHRGKEEDCSTCRKFKANKDYRDAKKDASEGGKASAAARKRHGKKKCKVCGVGLAWNNVLELCKDHITPADIAKRNEASKAKKKPAANETCPHCGGKKSPRAASCRKCHGGMGSVQKASQKN
jgi:ribosomal protein L40E